MQRFDHEKLDVYRTSVQWVALAQEIVEQMVNGKGHAPLADQLGRAASSISLNIAEGAGEFSSADKSRFYRMAKRSATECSAILDVAQTRRCITSDNYAQGRALLFRIVGMLVKLAQSHR